jgi:hypothetical protein
MKSMNVWRRVGMLALGLCGPGLCGPGIFTPGIAHARGPVGQTGAGMNALSTTVFGTQFVPGHQPLNALSTTPYGTQITPTNSGPVRPGAMAPRVATSNSIQGTMLLFGNTPYGGAAAAPSTAPGFVAPQFNGSGSAAGFRETSFPAIWAGPLVIPESLGNPQPGSGLAPWPKFEYRSLSAYGDLEVGKQSSPPVNSSSTMANPVLQNRMNPATTNIGIPGKSLNEPYDYHALSAYGDLSREQESSPPAKSPAGKSPAEKLSPGNTATAPNSSTPKSPEQ